MHIYCIYTWLYTTVTSSKISAATIGTQPPFKNNIIKPLFSYCTVELLSAYTLLAINLADKCISSNDSLSKTRSFAKVKASKTCIRYE